MKPSPLFYIIISVAVVLIVPFWLGMRAESAALAAQAADATKGVAGYPTMEEEAKLRHEKFLGKLNDINRETEENIEALKHEQEISRLRREVEDARADNDAARKWREEEKARRTSKP